MAEKPACVNIYMTALVVRWQIMAEVRKPKGHRVSIDIEHAGSLKSTKEQKEA